MGFGSTHVHRVPSFSAFVSELHYTVKPNHVFSFTGAADLIDELMSTDGEHLKARFNHLSFCV